MKDLDSYINDDSTLYECSFKVDSYKIKGCEIIGSIVAGLEVDIEVNGVTINKQVKPDKFENNTTVIKTYSMIQINDYYDVNYQINSSGVVTKIIYSIKKN
ncbi:hypothetical protein PV797_04455 [Clostridiaceae bacterium M8S5]|nr:hypothetical protein PV797_04455 [Clostridiaceae bacterium M8S5]